MLSDIVASWNGLMILTGDLNIDFCKTSDPKTKAFMSLLSSLNLHQHVKKPTRITRTTSTIIDHIISNTPNRITQTDVIPCPTISDHDAPYACINIRTIRYEPCYKMIRDTRQLNLDAFYKDCLSVPFSLLLGRILWHNIVQFRCPGSGTTLKQDK